MRQMPLSLLVATALGLATTSAHAALQITQAITSNAHENDSKMQLLIDGDNFRTTFLDSPMGFPAGSYMLGKGKDGMFFVAPARKSYARFDPEEFQGMAAKSNASMQGGPDGEQGHGMKRTLEDFLIKKELDEAGPAMFGLATRHYRYAMSYKEVMRMSGMPMAMTSKVSEVHEFWSTTELAEGIPIAAALAGTTMPSGNEAGDKKSEAQRTMAQHGMMLKSVTTEKIARGGMGGMPMMGGSRGGTTTRTMEVIALDRLEPPADAFILPAEYQETDMMNLFGGGGSRMPDLDETKGEKTKPRSSMPDLNNTPN